MAFKRTHHSSHTPESSPLSTPLKGDDDKYLLWDYESPVNEALKTIQEEAESAQSALPSQVPDETKRNICTEIIELHRSWEADEARFAGKLNELHVLGTKSETLHPDIRGIPSSIVRVLVSTLQLAIDETPIWEGPSDTDSRTLNPSRMEREAALRHICYYYELIPPILLIKDIEEPVSTHNPITTGAFGVVYKMKWRERSVALKALINLTNGNEGDHEALKNIKRFQREMVVWKQLRHQNITPLLGIWEWCDPDSSSKWPMQCMISPWAQHRDLSLYLRSSLGKSCNRTQLLAKIADALSYLHSHEPPLVHADLHPSNVLIDHNQEPRLTDFGLSTFYGSNTTSGTDSPKGVDQYLAPELLYFSGRRDPKPASDMYAFGCLGYTVYTLRSPWGHVPSSYASFQVRDGKRPARPSEAIPDKVWDIIESCWAHNPDDRIKSIEAWKRMRG